MNELKINKRGSRAEVFHLKAEMTTGGLRKQDLIKNKYGYIVSLKKVRQSKYPETNPLRAQGLLAKKNSKIFGPLRPKTKTKKSKNIFQPILNLFS
jgi:hypothetical protein